MKQCPKCKLKYKDTDFYCMRDNYRLIKCNQDELTEEERLKDAIDNEKYNSPNSFGNFSKGTKVPHCPTCNSANIHKISKSNKLGSAVFFGLFSLGHISKTFKCDNCGMKF